MIRLQSLTVLSPESVWDFKIKWAGMEEKMVTTGQMTGYAMAIALPLLAALIPFCIFWKRSSKIERGMLGAVGYGTSSYKEVNEIALEKYLENL